MAFIAPQKVGASPSGKEITYTAASAGGDRVAPGTDLFLLVKNASASSINVTLDATGLTFNGTPVADTVVAVAAGKDKLIPVRREYISPSDGLAGIAYSAVATVSIAVLQF